MASLIFNWKRVEANVLIKDEFQKHCMDHQSNNNNNGNFICLLIQL